MNYIRKYVQLIESLSRKKPINEGVKIGKTEIINTLKNSKDYQMGIEYEFLTPNPSDRVQEANDFVQNYNISHVEKIVEEHNNMMEIVTYPMPINEGIQHIRHFFKSAKDYGVTFPDTAGLHISISHKDAGNKKINYAKFLVLLSGDYLHSIFPERTYVENIDNEIKNLLKDIRPKSVKGFENQINEIMHSGRDEFVGRKYITAKLSDYLDSDGRVELRFFGGENYNKMFNEIRTQLLRSIYILGIALDDKVYRKEYLTRLGKMITVNNEEANKEDLAYQAYEDFWSGENFTKREKLKRENLISKSSMFSMKYARDILRGRFKKGEDEIATDALNSLSYAKDVIKGRFEKGEDIIAKDSYYAYVYARDVIKGRFEKGEDTIATDVLHSLSYAKDVLKGRFERGEDVISGYAKYSYEYARYLIKGRFKKGEETIAKDAEYSYFYAKDVINGRFKKGEDSIAQHPLYSVRYAFYVIKGRFEKGEDAIAQNTEYSYRYASEVIKGRFEKGEDIIAKNAIYSLIYAEHVIKGRFEKGEDVIAQNAKYSLEYAKKNLKGRFEKGEKEIAKNAEISYEYARDVLKDRFKKGEDVIATDAELSLLYAEDVIKGRFEKGEDVISTKAEHSFIYSKHVLNGRFEKGENIMKKNLDDFEKEEYYDLTGVKL